MTLFPNLPSNHLYLLSLGLELMDVMAMCRFLDKYLTKDMARPWETVRLQAAALTLINILYNTEYLPKKLKDTIPQYMTSVTKVFAIIFIPPPNTSVSL
jgi:hypothetical protein